MMTFSSTAYPLHICAAVLDVAREGVATGAGVPPPIDKLAEISTCMPLESRRPQNRRCSPEKSLHPRKHNASILQVGDGNQLTAFAAAASPARYPPVSRHLRLAPLAPVSAAAPPLRSHPLLALRYATAEGISGVTRYLVCVFHPTNVIYLVYE